MDFIVGLPKSKKQNDSIMMFVDKLSKTTHFNPVKSTYQAIQITDIFMREIFQLHWMPIEVIFDQEVNSTSDFWRSLLTGLGTQVQFSTAYHPQIDG